MSWDRPGAATVVCAVVLCAIVAGCATPMPPDGPAVREGRPVGARPDPDPALRQALIARATEEWEFFGRQVVVLRDGEESIPHVGAWEDEDGVYSARVNAYWRVVGKPQLDGMDCQNPWSAAFISWVAQQAGVPESQLSAAAAHRVYLAGIITAADQPGRFFVPQRVADYSPKAGDLVCLARGASQVSAPGEYVTAESLRGAQTHCDLVVANTGRTIEVIGGNVRNSVSKTVLELDSAGRLQPEPRRPWFLVLQNRL